MLIASQDSIKDSVHRLGNEITRDYEGKNPIMVCMLKGAFIFMADLVREIDVPLEVDFMQVSSYNGTTQTSGKPVMVKAPDSILKGRHVILVEDIVDTGLTAAFALEWLTRREPASLKLCSLLAKTSARLAVYYLGFYTNGHFVIGYGLDHQNGERHLKSIYSLEGSHAF